MLRRDFIHTATLIAASAALCLVAAPLAAAEKPPAALLRFVARLRAARQSSPVDHATLNRLLIAPEFHKTVLDAARRGDDALVMELLKTYEGTGVDRPDDLGGTALTWAAYYGNEEIMRALLAHPHDVNAGNAEGWTPLHRSVGWNNGMAKMLLEREADADSRTAQGVTPLMLAASNNFIEATALLLERGAKVNAVNNDGQRALMHASRTGRLNQVKLLLSSGANARVKDHKGQTALDVAALAPYASFMDSPGFLTQERAEELRVQAEADLKEIKRLLREAMGAN